MKKYNKQLLIEQVRKHHKERHYVRLMAGEKDPLRFVKWRDETPNLETLIRHIDSGGNIGMVCDDILVIDVDDHDGSGAGKKSFKKLSDDIGQPLAINTHTPNNGHHCYLRLPDGAEEYIRVRLPDYPGIDFLSGKRYVLLPGCEIGDRAYVDVGRSVPDAPPALVELIRSDRGEGPGEEDALGAVRTETEAEVRALLDGLDPNCHYDEWIRVGMALHHWRSGKEGITLWAQWSEGADKPATRAQMRRHWISFGDSENPVTLSSVHAQVQQASRPEPDAENGEDWVSEWVWVNNHGAFYDIVRDEFLGDRSFNMRHADKMPVDKKGKSPAPTTYYTMHPDARLVIGTVYDPTTSDKIVTDRGHPMVNRFRPETLPKSATSISDEADGYIRNIMLPHFMFLGAGHENRSEILQSVIAHNVQTPGVLLRWAPLIQGEQGVGKSWLRVLLEAVMGEENVTVVSAEQAASRFRSWATGSAVCVLEELKISGKNRYEVYNAIKPLITDPRVQIEEKYIRAYTTKNTTNYLAITNYKDALPLDEHDRRWWVNFTPPLSAMTDASDAHFDILFSGLKKFRAELRYYFESYPISAAFRKLNRAPMSAAKHAMIATGQSEQQIDVLRDLLAAGGDGYCEDVVCVDSLFEAYEVENQPLKAHERYTRMKKLGYTAYKNPIRWKGVRIRVWVRTEMTADQIKSTINNHWNSKGEGKNHELRMV